LGRALGVTFLEIPIKTIAQEFFKAIGHDETEENLVFENVQAWTRKIVLLATACQRRGIDLGTGDLSELLIGWCTMFGDHVSHYNPNGGVPKTLVSYLIAWIMDEIFSDEPDVQAVLQDVLDTPISPELLSPTADDKITQVTEDLVGPYELIDFFGYWMWRFSMAPSKVYRLAIQAFDGTHPGCGTAYTPKKIHHWLVKFIYRFFISQGKRSVLPDGPKVGLLAVSPRGDLRLPSDAKDTAWQEDLAIVPSPEEIATALVA